MTDGEAFPNRNALRLWLSGCLSLRRELFILIDILQLRFIHVPALLRLLIHIIPKAHPQKTKTTDDDESPLPAVGAGEEGDGDRCHQGSHRSSGIEDTGGQRPIFLGEVFSRDLDSSREVTALTNSQHHATGHEKPHAGGRDGECQRAAGLHQSQCFHALQAMDVHRQPTTTRMQTSTQTPNKDGDEIPFLRADPVDELS